ncbi:D-2-hydroxyacid dehydrogenase [Ornithinimicrobium avium]|uniref:D-2-hydroxyacid dehydrogenase n=1 Tax=Ornithinimicrobium avium TaxID=2283195 RepID=A0A345NND2_9MICO|nr:D-2-hydroxyacid dehydrogenase [Ornithinimicrobium avium]AXH96540.1 D-2-hydroxyacid dehydrogenase [Ornithinimicrobium avium]
MSRRQVLAVLSGGNDDVPPFLDELADRVEVRVTDAAGLGPSLEGADALLLWDFFSRAVRDVWGRADRLRWIHVAAAGVDTLLFDGLRDSGVVVTNARGTFDRPIAEYVLGAVLAHAKLVHESHDLQRRREWRHRETRTVRGARAMVVGTGGIGRETARLLRAVGMEVSGAGSRARDGDPDFGRVVASTELADHVGEVDYLVNAVPLTPATHGLVDARVLAALPERAHLVNVGRGPTVVEDDLLAALHAGSLDGATLDVFATEPLPQDSPLWDAPGLVVSPHMSGDVVGWRDALARQFVDNAHRWLAGEPLANVVDKQRGYVPGGSR